MTNINSAREAAFDPKTFVTVSYITLYGSIVTSTWFHKWNCDFNIANWKKKEKEKALIKPLDQMHFFFFFMFLFLTCLLMLWCWLFFMQLRKIIQIPDFPSKRNPHLRTKPLEQRRQELEYYLQVAHSCCAVDIEWLRTIIENVPGNHADC